MKLAPSALACACTCALAATATAQFLNQSAPFHLLLVSADQSVDGDTLSACHAGAAIESLCLSNSNSTSKPNPLSPSAFAFNTSDQASFPGSDSAPGILTYELRGGNFNVSSALELFVDPVTNVALPLLYPGDQAAVTLSFDGDDLLNIQGYVDDTVDPPVAGPYRAHYRWYACKTYYLGYSYEALAWVLGEGEPQNPSCVKVDVKRVFI